MYIDFANGKLESRLADKKIAWIVNDIRAVWEGEDYAGVTRRSRDLLEAQPRHTEGLIYMARAAALTGDWADVARAGAALAWTSPKDAFVAAGKLNRAGRSLEAARIFCELEIREDWFDTQAADLARKDAPLLIAAGEAAAKTGDIESSAIIWAAGARIAPRSQVLAGKVRRLTRDLKTTTLNGLEKDPVAYLNVCRLISLLNPTSLSSAVRFARASERSSAAAAIAAWLKVLVIAPGHEAAKGRLRSLAARHDLEAPAIEGLVAQGRDAASDPLVRELAGARDARVKTALDKRIRSTAQKASRVKRELDPQAYVAAWKDVLALAPKDPRAVRRLISGASHLRDYPALVDGWLAHLEITPDDDAGAERLVGAALRAGQEPRVLDYLARSGLVRGLPRARVEVLYRRVVAAGKTAVRDSDFDLALACYDTVALVDSNHPGFEGFRSALANGLAASARRTEDAGDRITAVSLAEEALEIVPDHPVALTMVARDLWREKRFQDLVSFCRPRVKADPKYDAVHEMLEQASFAA